MSIDLSSLKAIIGDSREVMVYGIAECQYMSIKYDIKNIGIIQAYDFETIKYMPMEFILDLTQDNTTDISKIRAQCKANLTSLLIENYKRIKSGQPIIPLIFCVGLKVNNSNQFTLDIGRILTHSNKTIANPELRRCYKCLTEMGDEIKKLTEQTFKFVNVVRTPVNNQYHYSLEEVPPFWNNSHWPKLWSDYSKNKRPSPKKDHPWRIVLAKKIAEIDAAFDCKEPASKRNKLS